MNLLLKQVVTLYGTQVIVLRGLPGSYHCAKGTDRKLHSAAFWRCLLRGDTRRNGGATLRGRWVVDGVLPTLLDVSLGRSLLRKCCNYNINCISD